MGKITLIYEQDSAVIGGASKTIIEAEPLTLTGAVEVFERFLRGAGFQFDGSIRLNNITEPNNCCGGCDEYVSTDNDVILNLDCGAAQPALYMFDDLDSISITGTNPELTYPEIKIDLEPIKKKL